MEESPEYFEGKGSIQRRFKDGTRKSVKAKNKFHQKNRQDEDEEPKSTMLPQKWSAKNFVSSSEDEEEIIEKMATPLKKEEVEGEEVLEERYSMDDIEHQSEDSDHSDTKKDKKKKNKKEGKKSKSKKEKN